MRSWFPALVARPELTYLDSAATTLMPSPVLDVVRSALDAGGSASRSGHALGERASERYEKARGAVAAHIGADARDVVFVRSATEGLNLVAQGWARRRLVPGDRVLVTALEHHSNLLPWRQLERDVGARVEVVGCNAAGDLDLRSLDRLLDRGTRVLALTHVSNVTGAVVDVAAVVRRVRDRAPGCAVVVDGSQAVAHLSVDVRALGADFYVFSGHKAYGPLGAGVVWGRPERWQESTPLLWGGGMVSGVADGIELVPAPWRFEAGTPNHVAAVGLAAGLVWTGRSTVDVEGVARQLAAIPGVRVLGAPRRRVGSVSFVVDGVHAHDVGTLLDEGGVAVRVGHLCAEPYLRALGERAAVRASFGAYSTDIEVRWLVEGIGAALDRLGAGS